MIGFYFLLNSGSSRIRLLESYAVLWIRIIDLICTLLFYLALRWMCNLCNLKCVYLCLVLAMKCTFFSLWLPFSSFFLDLTAAAAAVLVTPQDDVKASIDITFFFIY